MNGRIGQLSQLAAAIPAANQSVVSGMQQARETQLQQAIGGMTPEQAAAGPRVAQTIGAQQAHQAAQIQLQQQQTAQQRAVSAGQQTIAQDKMQKQKELFTRSQALSQKGRYLESELARISQNAKDKLLDQQLTFKRDELGRTLWNERQLADYKLSTAKNEEEFREYEQQVTQLYDRKLKMMEMAQRKLEQVLEQGYYKGKQKLDQASRLRITQYVAEMKRKQAREQAKARGAMAMFSGGGSLLGAAAGIAVVAATGGGALAAYATAASLGATVGGGVGTIAGASQ